MLISWRTDPYRVVRGGPTKGKVTFSLDAVLNNEHASSM